MCTGPHQCVGCACGKKEIEVWAVVGRVDYEFSDVLGIFSDEQKAENFKKKAKKRKSCKHYDSIVKEPFILDKER
jgi:hypothetical protein